MNIALIFSPNWRHHIPIEVYTIFKNNPPPIKVYLISDADGFIDLSYLTSHFGEDYKVEFINADTLFKYRIITDINVTFRFTKYTLYRLLLPELVQDDKLIYLDADTLVTGKIFDLYNMKLGKNVIAGAIDIGAYTPTYDLKTPIGLTEDDTYINAGVLLMNLKQIKDENIYEQWLFEVNNNKYLCTDQDILNKTCKGKIATFNRKYNVSISTGSIDDTIEDARIYHYSGLYKAWDSHKDIPNQDIWKQYYNEYHNIFGRNI